jgi:hypothetical protein
LISITFAVIIWPSFSKSTAVDPESSSSIVFDSSTEEKNPERLIWKKSDKEKTLENLLALKNILENNQEKSIEDIEVEITNTCKYYITTNVVNVFDAYKFEVEVYPSGLTSGIDGGFRHVLPINFFEEYIVFRQLPSMKLMKASEAINLINEPDPTKIQRQEHLYDLTNNKTILINTSNIISCPLDN